MGKAIRSTSWLVPAALVFLCLFVLVPGVHSQTLASVSVTVQDQSGGVVPKAAVALVSKATGLRHQVEADDNGLGRILNVSPGDYELRVESKGFKPAVRSLHLDVDNVYGAGDLIGPVPKHFGDHVTGLAPSFGSPRSIADVRQLQFSLRFSF